uniref:CD44 antigen n=1 Tax=Cyanistes caeruleus TaxID=156563 RepID=A0A8C0VHP6_CYACU
MANFFLRATFGLCLLRLCLTETEFNVSCRYGGVFHVEKNGRYSLTRSEAVELCRALNSTLATLEQLKKAHELGFETCRYGFVVGHIVIPRINPYHLCAANNTGIYKLSANTTARYDAYCYNATETEEKTCEPVVRIDTSLLSNQDETVIDNADGSRYNVDGTRHTGGESSTSGVDDENAGSGSTHETTPMDASIRRSSPSYYGSPTPVSQLTDHTSGGGEKGITGKDYDDEFPSVSPDISLGTVAGDFHEEDDGQYPASTTPGPHPDNLEETTTQAWWNPFSDHWWWSNPGEKTQEPTPATKDVTSSGSDSDDEDSSEEMMYPTVFPGWGRSVAKDETALSTTVDSQHETLLEITTQDHWNPTFTDEEEQYPSSASRVPVTTEKHQGPTQHPLLHSIHSGGIRQEQNPENTTGSIEQHEFTTAGDNYFGKDTSTAMVPSHGAKQNDSAQDPLVYPGWDEGEDYATQPAVTERVTPSRENYHERESSTTAVASPDGAHHKEPTQPHLPWDNESEMSTEGITNPTDAPGDEVLHRTTATMIKTGSTSSVYGNQGPHKGDYESTTSPGENTTTKIASQPRSAPVPDWLIIVAALVVLALILAVCIAVNSRRRCGQKKKLVINNGKGAVEDRKTSELNGDISKSQEMVHLVHKEQSNDRTQACDEFLTVNETQNHHEFDMKTGV